MLELLLFIIILVVFIALPKQRLFNSIGKAVNNTADTIDLVNNIWADSNKVAEQKWADYRKSLFQQKLEKEKK